MAQVEVNLRDLYRVLRKRKWIILAAPILMGLATYTLTQAPPPVYQAKTLVKINKSATLAGLMVSVISYGTYDDMATQTVVVTSRPVLEEVARRLNLIKNGVGAKDAVDRLKGQIEAKQHENSDILAITVTASSPEQAIVLANTVTEAYIKHSEEERNKRLDETVQFIRQQLTETESELQQTTKNVSDFKRANAPILATDLARSGDIQERRLQYQQKLQDARAALSTLVRLQQTKDYDALLQSFIQVDDAILRALADELTKRSSIVAELRARKADLLRYQTSASPQVVNLSAQLASEERRLESSLANVVRRLDAVAAEYDRLESTLARQEAELSRQPEVLRQLEDLQSVVKEKQTLASNLRQRLQDGEIQQKEKTEDITFVEKAQSAEALPQRNRLYQSLIGALIGILVGGVFAFVLESLDTSIGTIEDVERYIDSVVLGVIPHIQVDDVKSRLKLEDFPPNVTEEDLDRFARLPTHFDSKAVASEAYRTMRTNVASVMSRTNGKVVLITSSVLQEGKTTSATNLAVVFAQTGRKTLLIDADLRRPYVERVFGVEKSPGLNDILQGTKELKECYRTIDDIILGKFGLKIAQLTPGLEYLYLLPTGRTVENPAELLNSPMVDKLFAEAREMFDVILIDTSPILPVTDASILAPKVDGVILSYQIGRIGREVLKRSKLRLEALGCKVWGVIMNDIQAEIDYQRSDYHYYSYRYRYEPRKPESKGWVNRLKGRFAGERAGKRSRKPLSSAQKTPESQTMAQESLSRRSPPSAPANQELQDMMGLTDDDKK
ncbi:MAG: polysaccharide biosynthesis tyrosine autokinase [Acidobacteria bacterium]|nr:polysaccharide biosynthesis tyrosine autokinase [Acidobacteriota bacterium]